MNESFVDYVLDFYGQRGIYKDFFNPVVTKEEVEVALEVRKAQDDPPFDGDSFDRELVRDIMFARRGIVDNLEYPKVVQWIANHETLPCLLP
jgi:hypothetical protein